jgi:hypothetical protein
MTTSAPTKTKKLPSSPVPAKTPASPPTHVLKRWLITSSSSVGKHPLRVMTEQAGIRTAVLDDVRAVLRTHYVSPQIAAQRVADLGAVDGSPDP